MEFYRQVAAPVIECLDSETVHVAAREALHLAEIVPGDIGLRFVERFAYQGRRFADDRLKVKLANLELENPVGVGAGWDKVGRAVAGLHRLGFSYIEVGTVLPQP